MTTKLKSFLVLLAMMVGAVNSAWAQTADETYDFESWANSNYTITYGTNYAGTGLTNGKYMVSVGGINLNNRFADRADDGRGWFLRNGQTNNGLWCREKFSPEFAICGLLKDDRVKVTFAGGDIVFVNANSAKLDEVNDTVNQKLISGLEYTAIKDGDILLRGKSDYTVIKKIEIFYSNNRIYNFKNVQTSKELKPGGQGTTIDSHPGYKLDFINPLENGVHYDNSFNHPDNFRFFVYQDGWTVGEYGLHYTKPNTQGAPTESDFYILNIKKGDIVTVNYSGSSSGIVFYSTTTSGQNWGASMTSGTAYSMVNNGNLHLGVSEGVYIESIQVLSIAPRFSKLTDTYDLVTLSYSEPSLIGVPSGATVTYSGNNPQIAIPDSNTGDLMIVNTGDVTITATATLNNITYTASYTLTVKAAEANWAIRNGNECYFPGSDNSTENTGKLLVRKVTSVPYMNMEFGDASNSNLTMVTIRNGVRAANLIDENGWLHVWMNYTNEWLMTPYQGTFYKFQPAINGNLTIKGVRHHNDPNANSIVLVDASAITNTTWADDANNGRRTKHTTNNGTFYSYPIVKTLNFATADTYVATEEAVEVIGGHTYYLYANTPNTKDGSSDWQAFYLSGFMFETPNFKFPYQNVVMGATGVTASNVYHREASASSYLQTVSTSNVVYSRICKGGISCDIDSSTGQLSNISGSGAIVVTASIMDGQTVLATTSYVLTVPYTTIANGGTKSWIFNWANYDYNDGNPTGTNMMEQTSALKTNAPASEWSVVYKVRRYDTGTDALNYINVPVLANALDVRGDNARYISSTAGLLFNANAKTFGTTTSVKDTEYKTVNVGNGIGKVYKKVDSEWVELTNSADIDLALKALLNYNASDAVNPCNYLTMENGTSMTIPNLKAGQYVRIKWSRYAENQGDQMIVNNVKDLNGTDITLPISIGAGGNVNRNGGTGYHEFIVAADGDVTFTLNQKGWANIYEIHVSNNFTATDLKLDNGISLIRKKEEGVLFSNTYTTNWADVLCQSNTEVSYAIKAGTPTGTLTGNCYVDTDNKTLKVNSGGHGRFVLIQNGYVKSSDKTTSYLLDRNEIEIKVYEYDYSIKDYPYTWNLENMSAATATALKNDSSLTNNPSVYQYKTWKSKDANRYQLTLEPENLISWSTKASIDGSQTAIRELDGLGIHPADITKSNVIILGSDNTGVEFPSKNYTEIITVPNVATGQNAYIRVKKGDNPSVEAKAISKGITSDKTPTLVYDDGTYAAYKVEGGGDVSNDDINTIEFYLKNVTVMQVAVSTDTKHISAAGYATEARDYNLDFSLNQTLTGNGVTAYKVTGVNSNDQVVKSETPYFPAKTFISDETSKVRVDYSSWNGNGMASTEVAPAVTTSDGRQNVQMAEKYEHTNPNENTTGYSGSQLEQTITGLDNGTYEVEIYANAFFTSGREFVSNMVEGATNVAYVYANNEKQYMTCHVGGATTKNGLYKFTVEVTNGTLTLGLGRDYPGTNWHTIQIKSLTKVQVQGVLLKGNEGDYPLFTWDVNRTSSDMSGNKLIGVNEVTNETPVLPQKTGNYYNYVLANGGVVVRYFYEEGEEMGTGSQTGVVSGLGFYLILKAGTRLSDNSVYVDDQPNEHSAYLQLDGQYLKEHAPVPGENGVRQYFLFGSDDAAAVKSLEATGPFMPADDNAYYSLQGVRIENPSKGIYIRDGKKVVVK